jgi:hypothetical protein
VRWDLAAFHVLAGQSTSFGAEATLRKKEDMKCGKIKPYTYARKANDESNQI